MGFRSMVAESGAAFKPRPVCHRAQYFLVRYEWLGFAYAVECGLQNSQRPVLQIRVDAVIHPGAVAPGDQYASLAQVCQMAGNFGLRQVKRVSQFANAQFTFGLHQHQAAQAGAVGQHFEKAIGFI